MIMIYQLVSLKAMVGEVRRRAMMWACYAALVVAICADAIELWLPCVFLLDGREAAMAGGYWQAPAWLLGRVGGATVISTWVCTGRDGHFRDQR